MRFPFVGRRLLLTTLGLVAGILVASGLVEGAVLLMGRLGSPDVAAIAAGAPVPTSVAAPQYLQSPPPFKALPFAPPSPGPTQPPNPAPAPAQAGKAPVQNGPAGPQPAPHHKPHG